MRKPHSGDLINMVNSAWSVCWEI